MDDPKHKVGNTFGSGDSSALLVQVAMVRFGKRPNDDGASQEYAIKLLRNTGSIGYTRFTDEVK